MQDSTRKKMVEVIAAVASAFGREADEPMYLAFELGLDGLTAKQISGAAAAALKTCRFMPTPAELRELSGELPAKARAVIAWEFVSQAAAAGFYDTVTFDDVVINAAIRNIGGWEYLTTIEDSREWESFVRPKFEAAYVALYGHGVSQEQAAPLLGFHDRENAKGGYPPQRVRQIATTLPPHQPRLRSSRSRLGAGEPKRIGEILRSDP